MEMTKYCYHIDVILKSIATMFPLGTIKLELYKAFFWDDVMKSQKEVKDFNGNGTFVTMDIGYLVGDEKYYF